MLQVDLQAPTVSTEHRVWRLFPGEGYQFRESFQEQEVGFLDVPGLELPEGRLARATDILPRIARSQKMLEMLRLTPNAELDLSLADFMDARSTQKRSRLQNALISFFEVAKKDDFVVLPEPVYMSSLWIGQFISDEVVLGYYRRRYGGISVPARQIRWFRSVPENIVSRVLSQSLRHPHPFTILERSLHLEVLSLVYGSFVYGDRHVSTIYNSSDFLDADAALLGAISRLAAAALHVNLTRNCCQGEVGRRRKMFPAHLVQGLGSNVAPGPARVGVR